MPIPQAEPEPQPEASPKRRVVDLDDVMLSPEEGAAAAEASVVEASPAARSQLSSKLDADSFFPTMKPEISNKLKERRKILEQQRYLQDASRVSKKVEERMRSEKPEKETRTQAAERFKKIEAEEIEKLRQPLLEVDQDASAAAAAAREPELLAGLMSRAPSPRFSLQEEETLALPALPPSHASPWMPRITAAAPSAFLPVSRFGTPLGLGGPASAASGSASSTTVPKPKPKLPVMTWGFKKKEEPSSLELEALGTLSVMASRAGTPTMEDEDK